MFFYSSYTGGVFGGVGVVHLVIRPVFWGRRLKKVVNFFCIPPIFSSRTDPATSLASGRTSKLDVVYVPRFHPIAVADRPPYAGQPSAIKLSSSSRYVTCPLSLRHCLSVAVTTRSSFSDAGFCDFIHHLLCRRCDTSVVGQIRQLYSPKHNGSRQILSSI